MALRWRIAQLFELLWWRFYLAKREKKTYLTWKRQYWKQLLDQFELWPDNGSTVLDAGCGPAGVFMVLEHYHTDAVDPLLAAYAEHLPHFSPSDYPQVDFFIKDLENYVSEKKYDLVYCFNALNHVRNLSECLDNFSRLIRPGGQLVITVDAHKWNWVKRIFQVFQGDILHPHQFTFSDYQNMLIQHGFSPAKGTVITKGLIFDYALLVAQRPNHRQ